MKKHALLLILLTTPLAAQDLLTPEEFDAYTKGKTLFYGKSGQAYGAEIYYENRRVEWSFLDGDCKEGEWYDANGLICFVYENNPDPQCWSFSKGANGLIARFENRPDTTELYEANEGDQKMLCLGPKVGV
ncbi:hypothetical protein HKX54_06920 [Sulfitobacter sp. M57]|uniref:hypothetical protein n=1 Tax=unclassified Sulfitobacter TaxID=196795 RepID=UPI0023E33A80|nr:MULTISPECIES: hypothetical protein [unclassified Sulfitobacter]MDF3414182.1 hypothetical protein [Sulfitobacter sp. KE5]MDF3420537.1 hypothetical protein [Sulfitobacter sp. KE43]MDF3432728.1 hypothetical protein [Sulfitobacter sp. KE42]MDF3458367.1 hypothetical protein [Sulfitobacter sp. S74]MDF3462268.1 hypothetical protein [Sulfitobacter sp. Ks18]